MVRNLLLYSALAANILGVFGTILFESNDNVSVLVGFPAELRCVAFLVDNIHVPLIRWYKANAETLTPIDSSLYNPTEGALRFASAELTDAGWYLCNATSAHETNSTRLYFEVKDEIGFLTEPPNMVVVNRPGDVGVLDCNTTNLYTQLSFTWFNGTNPIPLGASAAVQLSGTFNERIIILSVAPTDIGNYTCQVNRLNTPQIISAVIFLSIPGYGPPMTGVGARPDLTVSIIEIEPDGDKRIELHCNIESLLTPVYVWTKNQVMVSAEVTSSGVFVREGTDIIVFTHATPSDSGVYNCTATNKLGSTWRAFRVTITEEDEVIWTRWWMILIYCIIFCLFLFSILILLIYVLCTGGLTKRKSHEDTTQLYDNTTTFDTSAMAASPAYDQFAETGSQTWEQKFTGDEDNQETGSQTLEYQFSAEKEDEAGSQTS